ncbi:MAG: hypothetical protein D3914_06095 [Candidatus Electrothrix sp. LOE2]|nr:hypothetical protein [Candidatus Electrothrix sp. LOE2]
MRTIRTNLLVKKTGRAIVDLRLPPDMKQGRYDALIIIEEQPQQRKKAKKPVRLPNYDADLADGTCTFRREDLYGDDGR